MILFTLEVLLAASRFLQSNTQGWQEVKIHEPDTRCLADWCDGHLTQTQGYTQHMHCPTYTYAAKTENNVMHAVSPSLTLHFHAGCNSLRTQTLLCSSAPYSCCAPRGIRYRSCRAASATPCCIWYSKACITPLVSTLAIFAAAVACADSQAMADLALCYTWLAA